MSITIRFHGSAGEEASIEVEEPRQWYRRWIARVGVRLWLWALEADRGS